MSRISLFVSGITLILSACAHAEHHPGNASPQVLELPQLHGAARVLRDTDGVRHIYAKDDHDALFLQGWFHAEDRLFQIDTLRRTASGTLAEVLGADALPSDVQLRTIGLRRAAERSLAALSKSTREGIHAYADGINAWVAKHALPPEYGELGLTRFEPWSALDTVTIAKAVAFQLSFSDEIGPTLQFLEYQAKLSGVNPQLGAAVYHLDAFRSAPMAKVATVPEEPGPMKEDSADGDGAASAVRDFDPNFVELLKRYKRQFDQVPFLRRAAARRENQVGSNEWAISGAHTRDGRAIIANDPHLELALPSTLYDVQIVAERSGLDAIGSSFPGVPWIILGQNRYMAWGETVTGFDVTDFYQEQIVADPESPSGLSTIYRGSREPIVALPVTFKVNLRDGTPDRIVVVPPGGAIPSALLIVPRRNDGPLLQTDIPNGIGVSVQYTGFGPTRELDSFRQLNYARNLREFTNALQFFDFGSSNFVYGDIEGNIGYFTTGEVPLREDLQAGMLLGSPPWFIRDGRGGNEWLKIEKPGATDGTGYRHLPFAELPKIVNPVSGYVLNANNDPIGVTFDNDPLNQARAGGGILYLAATFDFGSRAGRIEELMRERLARGPVDRTDVRMVQADVALFDAKLLTPRILAAFDHARSKAASANLAALARDPGVAEAVERFRQWNYTTPTGLQGDTVRNSVAATLYTVWRGQVIANGLDKTLTRFGLPLPPSDASLKAIVNLIERNGIGQSTLDYFAWTAEATAEQRRDFVILKSMRDTLDLLSGPSFAPAFAGSKRQSDYIWGKLHRVSFDAVLGAPFSIPGATPGFPPTFPTLKGLASDGGFGTVDVASHNVRATAADGFMFNHAASRRYIGSVGGRPGSITAETSLPGGISGVLGDRFYANLLGRYLRNETYPLRQSPKQVVSKMHSEQRFVPARRQ